MNRTKLLAPLAAVVLAATAASPAFAAEPQVRALDDACPAGVAGHRFVDVAAGSVHDRSISCVVHWDVANGRTATEYAPTREVTRGQLASFVARAVEATGGRLAEAPRDWFADDDGSVHETSINRLAEAGIVRGPRPGGYVPAGAVTRAHIAAVLVRAYDHRAAQDSQAALPAGGDVFADTDGTVLAAEIGTAAAAGLVGGYGDRTYRPGVPVRRDQAASTLARALDLVVGNGMAAVPAGPPSDADRVPTALLDAYLADNQTTLRIAVDTCKGSPGLDELTQDEAEVRVTVLSDEQGPGPQPACADLVTVELDQPLGGRDLVDGSTGRTVEVR